MGVLDALNDSAFGRVSARRGLREYYSRVRYTTYIPDEKPCPPWAVGDAQ